MIILDTNVFSEPTKQRANASVVAWLERQQRESLFLTAVSLAEIMEGIELLPDGKRKSALRVNVHDLIAQIVSPLILPFDREAAFQYAAQAVVAKARRYTLGIADAQIAAIAKAHDFVVATRDVDPFRAVGLAVINPWEA